MYRFILGGAASGKSSYVYETLAKESIKHPEREHYLFVPEQNTLMAQKRLCFTSERGGILNVDVLSFTLLTYRVFSELGIKKPDVLDDMTKSLLIRKALRLKKKDLRLYHNKVDSQGFLEEFKRVVSELSQYDIDTERLRTLSDEGKGLSRRLADKLHDIAEIYDCFNSLLGASETIPEELPKLLLRELHRSRQLRESVIYFDGFAEFTPIQLKLIAHILDQASEVSFCITLPKSLIGKGRGSRAVSDADIFWKSRQSMARIGELGDKGGIEHGEDLIFESRAEGPAIRVFKADTIYEEVRFAANDIKRRVLGSDGELRYSGIALVLTDEAGYKETVRSEFEKAGISYFMDENVGSSESRAAELILSAVTAVLKGYRYEDVSRYIKDPLTRLSLLKRKEGAEESGDAPSVSYGAWWADPTSYIDIFDNYIRAKGIRGRRLYEKTWDKSYRGAELLDLDALSRFKDDLMEPLFLLHDRFREAGTIREYTKALAAYLSDISFPEAVSGYAKRLRSLGYADEAVREESIAEGCIKLLSRMDSLMGEESSSMRDFFELLSAGIGSMKVGVIPQSMDSLLIGDMRRSRYDGVKLLYILGANDGLIPAKGAAGGIFTERERGELGRAGLEMAPHSARLAAAEEFTLYQLLHKASAEVLISYSKEDKDGRALKPAEFISALDIKERTEGTRAAFKPYINKEKDLISAFSAELSERRFSSERTKELYAWLLRRDDTRSAARRLMDAAYLRHEKGSLAPESAKRLYGSTLYGSVTRIETFERCPYSHFLRYGMGLLERQSYDVEAVDIGNLYHSALELSFKRLDEEKLSLTEASDEELDSISSAAVEAVTEGYNDSIFRASARNSFFKDKVSRITKRTLRALKDQAAKGDFITAYCELPFKLREEGLELHGRIDRVDICEDKLETYVRVIDYKSGKARFDLSLIYHGLQLQLVTYMDAAIDTLRRRKGGDMKPAGLYYYNIDDPVISYAELSDGEPAETKILKRLKMNGLSNSDKTALRHLDRFLSEVGDSRSEVVPVRLKGGEVVPSFSNVCDTESFSSLLKKVRGRIAEDAGRILGGDIDIRPYRQGERTGCDYCLYHSVCGFTTSIEGAGFRELRSVPREKLEEELFGKRDEALREG